MVKSDELEFQKSRMASTSRISMAISMTVRVQVQPPHHFQFHWAASSNHVHAAANRILILESTQKR